MFKISVVFEVPEGVDSFGVVGGNMNGVDVGGVFVDVHFLYEVFDGVLEERYPDIEYFMILLFLGLLFFFGGQIGKNDRVMKQIMNPLKFHILPLPFTPFLNLLVKYLLYFPSFIDAKVNHIVNLRAIYGWVIGLLANLAVILKQTSGHAVAGDHFIDCAQFFLEPGLLF